MAYTKCQNLAVGYCVREEICNSFFLFSFKNFAIIRNRLRKLVNSITFFFLGFLFVVAYFLLSFSLLYCWTWKTYQMLTYQPNKVKNPTLSGSLIFCASLQSHKLFCLLPIPQLIQKLHLHLEGIS